MKTGKYQLAQPGQETSVDSIQPQVKVNTPYRTVTTKQAVY